MQEIQRASLVVSKAAAPTTPRFRCILRTVSSRLRVVSNKDSLPIRIQAKQAYAYISHTKSFLVCYFYFNICDARTMTAGSLSPLLYKLTRPFPRWTASSNSLPTSFHPRTRTTPVITSTWTTSCPMRRRISTDCILMPRSDTSLMFPRGCLGYVWSYFFL